MKRCPRCKEVKPRSEFRKDHRAKDGLGACKRCSHEATRRWAKANAEYVRKYKRRAMWKRRGVNVSAAEAALSAHDGTCDLCGTAEPRGRYGVWHIDHEHGTGRVRGVLCSSCNHSLSLVDRVGLERIRSYLQRGSAGTAMKNEVYPSATTEGGQL